VKEGHTIVRCPRCGLLRRAELPGDDELKLLYGLDYFTPGSTGDPTTYLDYLGDAELHRRTARKRLRLLERLAPVGSLLDVGCAAGFFVDEAGRRGWDAEGIDLSEEMTAWGRSCLGARVGTLPFASVDLPPESVDVVTMWDYIEHSNDPAADVRRAWTLLRPGGWLALSTGDSGSLVARLSGRRWHLLTPRHHLFYWDRRTLRLLVEQAGLELVQARALGSSYSLRHLVYKLRAGVDVPPLRVLNHWLDSSRIGGVSVPVNLGDIVTVLARKPR